jgi:F-type H+-transporting ATPase subunit delta
VKNLAIARRYAKALLLIGKEDGEVDKYREELNGVSSLLSKEKMLEQAICNPLYAAEGRKKVLQKVIERMGLSQSIKSFLLLVFDKGRMGFISTINEFYQKLADELKGIAQATLTSAASLSDETVEKIRQALSVKIGKQIILEVKQDPSLIGGVVTHIGDLVLDGSIKTQLFSMKESLKRGEMV